MNHPARLFQHLVATWHQDVSDDSIEILGAEMAAQVAATGGLACVGLVRAEAVRRLFGLACFLDTFGLTLRQRYLKDRSHAFVFVEVQAPKRTSEYDGARVIARPLAPEAMKVAA